MLNHPDKPCEVADDIESFFHLLSLFALRFHKSELDPDGVRDLLNMKYDKNTLVNDFWQGSLKKYVDLLEGHVGFSLANNPPFKELLSQLADVCKAHYHILDADLNPPEADPTIFDDSDDDELDHELAKPSRLNLRDFGVVTPAPAHTPLRTLDTHIVFQEVLYTAVSRKDWRLEDKGEDKFAEIVWPRVPKGKGSRTIQSVTGAIPRKRGSQSVDELNTQPGPTKKTRGSNGASFSGTNGPAGGTRSRSGPALRGSNHGGLPPHQETN